MILKRGDTIYFKFDLLTILLIVLILIFFVFIFADYKVLKAFFEKEKDRNISFTTSQYESYLNSNAEDKISEEFIEEVLEDIINESVEDSDPSDKEEKVKFSDESYDNF